MIRPSPVPERSGRFVAILAAAALWSGLALAAKPGLTSYFPAHFKDVPYQKAAIGKVMKTWTAPAARPGPGKKTVVQSTIGRDGKLVAAIVTMKTGIKAWDDAALRAVQKAPPFPPFPRSFPDPHIEVHWHFAMNP